MPAPYFICAIPREEESEGKEEKEKKRGRERRRDYSLALTRYLEVDTSAGRRRTRGGILIPCVVDLAARGVECRRGKAHDSRLPITAGNVPATTRSKPAATASGRTIELASYLAARWRRSSANWFPMLPSLPRDKAASPASSAYFFSTTALRPASRHFLCLFSSRFLVVVPLTYARFSHRRSGRSQRTQPRDIHHALGVNDAVVVPSRLIENPPSAISPDLSFAEGYVFRVDECS